MIEYLKKVKVGQVYRTNKENLVTSKSTGSIRVQPTTYLVLDITPLHNGNDIIYVLCIDTGMPGLIIAGQTTRVYSDTLQHNFDLFEV